MAEQRQPFRFRLPWLAAMASRPTTEPQPPRPTPQIQAPPQPTSSVPIQRPPFRPAGIAPAQAPPQTQPAPRTEPQPPPPYRAPTESRVASQPTSPSRGTQTRAFSVPPESRVTSQPTSPSRATTTTRSPSRAASTQTRAASVPPSPSRTASQIQPVQPRSPSRLAPQSTSQPSSPMRKSTQVQPTARAVSQAPSPSKKRPPPTQDTSRPPLNLISLPSSVLQEKEPKPAETLQLRQEPQPKTGIKSEIVSESQFQSGGKTTFKPDRVVEQTKPASNLVTVTPASTVAPEAPAAPQKLESVPAKAGHPMTLAEEKKLKENEGKKDAEELVKEAKSEDGKRVARELVKEENPDGSADEQMRRSITKFVTGASGLETQNKIKEFLGTRIRTEESKQEKHDIFDRKKPVAPSISEEKHIKTVSATHQKDRNVLGNQQKSDISNGEKAPLHKEIREDISRFVHKLITAHPKQPMGDRPVSIITVAGENRGASMHLASESAKKDGSVHIHRGYKLKSDQTPETTTDGEGTAGSKSPRNPTTRKDEAPRAYVNSNTQSINNSILLNSSVNERNPGIQMVFSQSPAESTKSAIKPEAVETHKAQFTVTPAENLTYQPILRRRCLRGLLLEPSDSDPDNPEKPRRHGCLYNCGEKNNDKEIRER